jgi:[acyl-carrier-protein] S-malonyltransferase
LYAPVLWVDSIKAMRESGIEKIIECGPGKVLSGLIRRIEPDIACSAVDESASMRGAIEAASA